MSLPTSGSMHASCIYINVHVAIVKIMLFGLDRNPYVRFQLLEHRD